MRVKSIPGVDVPADAGRDKAVVATRSDPAKVSRASFVYNLTITNRCASLVNTI